MENSIVKRDYIGNVSNSNATEQREELVRLPPLPALALDSSSQYILDTLCKFFYGETITRPVH